MEDTMNTTKNRRLTVKAVKRYLTLQQISYCPAPGGRDYDWQLIDSDGDLPEDGYGHATRSDAYESLCSMYSDPIWDLRKEGFGYSIVVD